MFNKEFLEEIKTQLKEKKKEAKKMLKSFTAKSTRLKGDYEAKFPNYGRAEDENADEVALFTDRLCSEKVLEDSLERIELSLRRIKTKKFGICESCSEKISKKRLRAVPTALNCIACKKKS
ncbi:TraR/DksA C4-type zinc finger protein [Patescibacteria group bacterium]|nr:TraR/DksA C4-type zinc finger protein [Patescibacteria group bacterium]